MDFQLDLNTEKVDKAFPGEPPLVEPHATVHQVLEILKARNTGCVLVCKDDVLVGIFTERDALRLLAAGADLHQQVEQVMSAEPHTLSPEDTVGKAISKMSFGGYRRLPIVDADGRPQGMLKVPGILHYLVEHFPEVVYNLPPKPHHSTQEREGA